MFSHGAERIGPIGVGANYDGKERVFNQRGGLLTTEDVPVLAGVWPTDMQLPLVVDWQGPAGSSHRSTFTHGSGARDRQVLVHELGRTLGAGQWTAVVKPQSRGYQGGGAGDCRIKFVVAESHPHMNPGKRDNDKLIAAHWKAGGLCLEDTNSLMSHPTSVLRCSDVKWSSMRTGGDIDANDIMQSRH